ncbi:hypothetical protein KY289_035671 [Solanum tuberosum]|nr:hypothetical protein KY289_035671 [Solanum tuberosum]
MRQHTEKRNVSNAQPDPARAVAFPLKQGHCGEGPPAVLGDRHFASNVHFKSPDAKRWLHLVTKRIRPLGNHTDVTFPRTLVVACAIQGIRLNVSAQIISEWKVFYWGNKKAVSPGLAFTSRSKRRKTDRAGSSQAAVEVDDEGGVDDEADGARVEEDLAVVRRRLGCSYASTTPVPRSITGEVEMLCRQLHQERRKGLVRDRLMTRMWKTLKVVFSCVSPGIEVPRHEPKNYTRFSMLNEALTGVIPSEDLDSDYNTSLSQGH